MKQQLCTFILLTTCALLQACVNQTELAKQAVSDELIERRDVEYKDMVKYPGGVVCGQFNSFDKWGRGKPQFSPFIVRDGKADLRPNDNDWAIYCSKDPEAALLAQLGIGPVDSTNAPLEKIRRDLSALDAALQQYLADNHRVPSPKQTMDALVALSPHPPKPRKFPEDGYLNQIPVDPWGRPYLYTPSSFGGVSPGYRLETLGADGVEGGEGENADVGKRHLEYLDHINNL